LTLTGILIILLYNICIRSSVYNVSRNDKETFSVTSYTTGSGSSFLTPSLTAFGTAPVSLGTYTVSSQGAASATVYYTSSATASGSNFANLTFTVTDAASSRSSAVTVQVSINPVNHAPTANPAGPIPLAQDSQSAYWNLNGTDADPADANSLKVQIMVLPTKGTMVQQGGSNITSVPLTLTNPNIAYRSSQTGDDTFSFRVVDNLGAVSALQVVHFTISPVNHPPTAVLSTISTLEDQPVTAQVSTYDQDGDTVTVYISTLPIKGRLTQFDGTPITAANTPLTDSRYRFIFQGNQYDSGTPYATISLYADDGNGLSTSHSATITTTINVNAVNYPPVPQQVVVVLNENDPPTNITLLGTDIETPNTLTGFLTSLPPSTMGYLQDLQGNPIAIRAVIPTPRLIQFVPALYQKGNVTFSFGVNDGTQDSTNAATATLVIVHVNHPPSATATSPVTVTRTVAKSINLIVSDFDIGDVVTVTITSLTGGGQLFYGSTQITSTFTVGAFTIPSSNSITVTLTYIAPATASGSAFGSFTFVAQDNGSPSLSCSPVTVSMSIAQNSIPVARAAGPLNVVQDSTSLPLPLNGTDADVADANSLQVMIMSLPTKGTLRIASSGVAITAVGTLVSAPGAVTYSTTQRAADQFSFSVVDNLNAASAAVTVSTSVTPVNHPPSAFFVGTASALEDSTLVITNMQASDPDGDAVSIYVYAPTNGTIQQYDGSSCITSPCLVTDSQYRMKFIPAVHAYGTPYATYKFVAYDGVAYSTPVNGSLTIQFVDYPPVALNSIVQLRENDQNVQVTFSYSDFDTAPTLITVLILSLPPSSFGTLTSGGTALNVGDTVAYPLTVSFTPALYTYGNASFSFKAKDAQSFSNVGQVTLNITHVNHPPTAYFVGTASASEDSILVITQIQGSDPDVNDVLSVSVTQLPVNGTLQQYDGSANCTTTPCRVTDSQFRLKFIPLLHGWGNSYASFQFSASDGLLTSATVTANLSITFVDYPPVASASSLNITENNSATSFSVSYSDFDSSPSVITTTILSLPSANVGRLTAPNGTVLNVGDSVNGFGLVFTPILYSPGNTSFLFKVRDAQSYSNVASVAINVAHVNHAPTAFFVGTAATNEDTQLIITQIHATDPDAGDQISVYISQPYNTTAGTLYQYDNTSICSTFPCRITDSQYRLRYTPALHGWGNPYAYFLFYASDGQIFSQTVNATLNINFVDYPPVASSSTASGTEDDSSIPITFSYSDFDSSPSVITSTVVSLPSASIGTILNLNNVAINIGDTITGYSIKFIPVQYSPGTTSFSFKVKDAQSFSNTATVTVNVMHVNHAPSIYFVGQAIADEDTNLTITQIQISDPDRGDILTAIVNAAPSNGALVQMDGTPCGYPCYVSDSQFRLKLIPVPDGNGLPYTSIQIRAWDGAAYSGNITAQLYINPVNDPPVAYASSIATDESTQAIITLNVTDIDTLTNQLSVVIQALPSASIGSLTDTSGTPLIVGSVVNSLQVVFVPVQYADGDTTFSFNAYDGQYSSPTVSVSVHINPIPQAPACGILPSGNMIVQYVSNTTIELTVFDPDPGEHYTFYLISITTYTNGGTLSDPQENPITPSTNIIASSVTTSQMYGQISVYYLVTNPTDAAYMVMQFKIYDGALYSPVCTLTLNSTANVPPNPVDVGTYSFSICGVISYLLILIITFIITFSYLNRHCPRHRGSKLNSN
jgi:hypothetical protein